MADTDYGHDRLTTDDAHHLRRYIVQATTAILCVSGWVGIVALLLRYGPPALSVSGVPTRLIAVASALFSVVLSAGVATIFTIVLAVGVLALIDWIRSQRGQDAANGTDDREDEPHV